MIVSNYHHKYCVAQINTTHLPVPFFFRFVSLFLSLLYTFSLCVFAIHMLILLSNRYLKEDFTNENSSNIRRRIYFPVTSERQKLYKMYEVEDGKDHFHAGLVQCWWRRTQWRLQDSLSEAECNCSDLWRVVSEKVHKKALERSRYPKLYPCSRRSRCGQ